MSNRTKNRLLAAAAVTLIGFVMIVVILSTPAVKPPEAQPHRISAKQIHAVVGRGKVETMLPVSKKNLPEAEPVEEESEEEEETAAEEPEAKPQDEAEPEGEDEEAGEEDEDPVEEKKKPEGELSAPEVIADANLVAHGLGSLHGLTQLNCREAFRMAYAQGIRVFEADLRLTRDCKVVLRHDWWPSTWQEDVSWVNIPTLEKFLSEKILNSYTPLSFRDLLLLMEQYPDICVITDSKYTESDVFTIQFDAMLADARELGLTYLFDRMFIQIYSGNMRTALNNIYPFPHYIYTLYQDETPFTGTAAEFREKAAYAQERGIEGITMDAIWWKPEFAAIADKYGLNVYVHTVNDADTARRLLAQGVDAVYTDSLRPKHFS